MAMAAGAAEEEHARRWVLHRLRRQTASTDSRDTVDAVTRAVTAREVGARRGASAGTPTHMPPTTTLFVDTPNGVRHQLWLTAAEREHSFGELKARVCALAGHHKSRVSLEVAGCAVADDWTPAELGLEALNVIDPSAVSPRLAAAPAVLSGCLARRRLQLPSSRASQDLKKGCIDKSRIFRPVAGLWAV